MTKILTSYLRAIKIKAKLLNSEPSSLIDHDDNSIIIM